MWRLGYCLALRGDHVDDCTVYAGLAAFLWRKQSQHQLWVPAAANEDGAVFDSDRRGFFKPGESMADFTFLFLTYEPSKWWWEPKELLRKFSFCGVSDSCSALSQPAGPSIDPLPARVLGTQVLMLMGPEGGGSSPDQVLLPPSSATVAEFQSMFISSTRSTPGRLPQGSSLGCLS